MVKKTTKKPKQDSERVKELKHHARRKSIQEGIFATGQYSFGNTYLSPFAIAINTSDAMISLLGSIGGLFGPLSQMFSSRLIEKYPRKKIVLHSVFWEAILWIPFILIAILYSSGVVVNLLPLFLMLFFAINMVIANIAGPAWFSWIGDIVDEEFRGRWFAKRNLIHGFISIILSLAASFFLDFFKNQGWLMLGFMILFALALVCRLLSWQFFKSQYEPKIKLKKADYFSFWQFLERAPKTNFGRFTIFRAVLAFAQTIGAPLFTVYLLRNLGFTYTIYITITVVGSFFSIVLIDLWGKFADRYGNYKTMIVTAFFIPVVPILWTLSSSPLYQIFIPSIISGLAWAGFNLASGNFIYDNVRPEKRGVAVSYYNMLVGLGTFLGAGLGAILIAYLNTSWIEPIILIFLICAVARMFVIIFGIPYLKEVRKTREFSGKSAFKNIIVKGTKSTLLEEAHQIMSIKEYIFEK